MSKNTDKAPSPRAALPPTTPGDDPVQKESAVATSLKGLRDAIDDLYNSVISFVDRTSCARFADHPLPDPPCDDGSAPELLDRIRVQSDRCRILATYVRENESDLVL